MTAKPQILAAPQALKLDSLLSRAEFGLLGLIALVGLAAVVLATGMGRVVDWAGFAPGIAAAMGLVAVGVYARAAKGAQRLGQGAIGVGIFMGFTAFASIFIFALFPLYRPLIDTPLIAADAMLGYDWAGFVTGLAAYPLAGLTLRYVYLSALPQMVLVIILLSVMGRNRDMQRFLLVGMASMVVTVGIFFLWPSIGPSAYTVIPADTAARIQLIFTSAVGEQSRHLVDFGPDIISPETIVGLVAFPSFHIIMALMVSWFSRGTIAFPLFAGSSLAMIPATLAHGGHHLVDLLGGAVVFAVMVAVASRVIPAR